MIKIVEGNVLDATEDIICQQVNCQGIMGSGLAKQIIDKYPEVNRDYQRFCLGYVEYRESLLGQLQSIIVHDGKIIANLFGQYHYGRNKQYTDYNALRSSLEKIYSLANMFNYSIALPYNIGCGLGGGNWDIVYNIIEEVFENYDITIYKLPEGGVKNEDIR